MGGLAPQHSLFPHTSLRRGQHKTTGLHLLRDSRLAPFPGEVQSLPARTYSRSNLPIITSVLAHSVPCNLQNYLLFLAQILPKLELHTLSAQSQLPESIVSSFCLSWDSLLTAVHAHTQQFYIITCTHNCRAHAHRSPTASTGAPPAWYIPGIWCQAHSCVLPSVADVPDIFPRVLHPCVVLMGHLRTVAHSLESTCLKTNCTLETKKTRAGGGGSNTIVQLKLLSYNFSIKNLEQAILSSG